MICFHIDARNDLFALEIKVQAFSTTDSLGRKVYCKGSVIKWDVEIGSFTLEPLMQSLQSAVKWSSNQCATVWFFDKNLKEDVRVTSEIQMIDLFDMYKAQMSCHFVVGVLDKSVSNAPEFDLLEPLCVIPPDDTAPTDAMLDGAANANANALPDIPTNATAFLDSPTNANAFPDSNTNLMLMRLLTLNQSKS